jgi:hypothetical protein
VSYTLSINASCSSSSSKGKSLRSNYVSRSGTWFFNNATVWATAKEITTDEEYSHSDNVF